MIKAIEEKFLPDRNHAEHANHSAEYRDKSKDGNKKIFRLLPCSEPELLRTMFDVGYLPPNTPPGE